MSVLVIFDVDGTLTDSAAVDAEANVAVMGELFDIADVDTDWSHYPHTTDGAIFDACFSRRWGRPATAAEHHRFEATLGDRFEAALARAPQRCPPLGGAAAMLRDLTGRAGVSLALATGAYERSMRAKLGAAGLERLLAGVPRATGSDARTREDLVTLARQRAGRAAPTGDPWARVVSVGDGVWDARTAQRLRLDFVGVASGDARARLRGEGATTVVEDYLDLPAFLSALGC